MDLLLSKAAPDTSKYLAVLFSQSFFTRAPELRHCSKLYPCAQLYERVRSASEDSPRFVLEHVEASCEHFGKLLQENGFLRDACAVYARLLLWFPYSIRRVVSLCEASWVWAKRESEKTAIEILNEGFFLYQDMNPVCDVNPFSHQCSLHMLHGNVKHPSATTILEWTQILFPAYIHNNDWTGLVNSLVYVGIKLGHFSMHECMAMPKDNPKDLWLYIKSIIEIKGKENPSDSSSSSYFSMAAKGLYCWNAFNYAHHLLSADKIHDHVESTSLFFFYSKASLPQSKNTRSPEGPSKIQRREEGEATMVYTQVDSSNMQSLQSCLDAWKLLHQITPVPEGRNTNLQAGDGELKALLDFMPKSTIWWMVAIIDTHLGSGQPLPSVFMDRLKSELEFLHKLLSGVPLNHRLVISSRIFFQLYQAELKTSPVEVSILILV
eukprot:TRINITY_DN3817_c0_g1_i1.p1 TRINITY_DN3817_c0_g1~~TRINITY_DN3817_c0_g1_i1.p1  ORF type:complete len:436 (+),score=52.45 TRINITY_DN3817_c0_g1_i1:79-1386(+)